MKKIIAMITCFAFLFILCSCSKPIDCSICEMNFKLPGKYTLENDRETANSKLNKAFDDSMSISFLDSLRAEDYLDVKWYYGDESDVVVTAMYSPHNNDDLNGAIEAAGITHRDDEDDGSYTFFDLSEGKGRRGEEGSNYDYRILHNGILYDVTFFNTSEDDFTETEINDFIDSIFFDDKALKNQTVECGDISLKLSGEYQPLGFDEKEGWNDFKAYGRFGKIRIDFSISYFDPDEYGSASELVEHMKSFVSDADSAVITEEFGKCYYLCGRYEGKSEVIAFFEKNGKTYMIDLLSGDGDLSIDDIKIITKTID